MSGEIHSYAADKMFDAASNKLAHETAIALAGYLLGEIGENICQLPGKSGKLIGRLKIDMDKMRFHISRLFYLLFKGMINLLLFIITFRNCHLKFKPSC